MRNLKRALSMLLSSTMVLGMVVMGGSAAGYQDVDDSYNKEAIEVLQAVGIMTGDENGDFNPDGIVTRNEMAVIMSNLMAYNVATYAGTSPFTDVPEWAEPYVAACYTNGITAGISDTLYGGDQTVTTSQAALMIMKALGYFQYQSDFGGDWQLASITQGNKIDLFEKVNSGVKEEMTRNDVAQLVLNGLKSGTVMAETSGTITVGDTTIVSGVKYNYVTSTQEYARTISAVQSTTSQTDAQASIVELGEKLYQGKLTQASYEEPGSLYNDVFGRPATHWEYQSKAIGTYAQEADTSFSGTVTSKKLYDAVGNTATTYNWYVTVDGEALGHRDGNDWVSDYTGAMLNTNKTDDNDDFLKKAGIGDDGMYTGNGTRTEVYVDGTKGVVFVSVTHYYAAEVYEVEDGYITLNNLHTYGNYADKIADIDDAYETSEEFAEDDIVMYSFADQKIQEVYAATPVEGEVTRVRVDSIDVNGDYFDLGEDRYNYNVTTDTDDRLTTENVNNNMVGYLDQYGYAAYIDEAAVSYDYAYVLSMGDDGDQYGGGGMTYYARLVLTDGTVLKVETDAKTADVPGLRNHIVSYTVDKNDVYTLVARDENEPNKMSGTMGTALAPTEDDLYIESGVAAFTAVDVNGVPETYTANSNTVFIVAESDNQSIEDYDYYIYTGIKNVPDIKGQIENGNAAQVAVAADKDGVAKVVYVQDADVSGAGQVIFARADENAKLVRDSESGDFYEISAVVDGEVTTLNVKYGSEAADKLMDTLINANIGQYISGTRGSNEKRIVALESITTNADGLVTNVRAYEFYNADKDGWDTFVGTNKYSKETVGLGYNVDNNAKAYYDDVAVVRYNKDSGSFKVSSITSVKDDQNDAILGVFASGVLNGLCIVEVANGEPTPADPVVELEDVPVDIEVPGFSATFDGTQDGGTIPTVNAGDEITIVITLDAVRSRAIGETPTAFEVGHWYQVSINGVAQEAQECTVAGQLTINYVVKADDADGINVTAITEVAAPEQPEDPDANSYEVTFSAEGVTVTYEDGTAVTSGAMVDKNAAIIVTPAQGYTVTVNGDPITEATTYTVDKTYNIVATKDEEPAPGDYDWDPAFTVNRGADGTISTATMNFYKGEKDTSETIAAYVDSVVKASGKITEAYDQVVVSGTTATLNAIVDNKYVKVADITLTQLYKVTLDGETAGYAKAGDKVELNYTAAEGKTLILGTAPTDTSAIDTTASASKPVVNEGTLTDKFTAKVDGSSAADIDLWTAYETDLGSNVTITDYDKDGTKTTTSTYTYAIPGTKVYVQIGSTSEGDQYLLKQGDTILNGGKPVAGEATNTSVDEAITLSLNSKGAFDTITANKVYTLMIDGVKQTINGSEYIEVVNAGSDYILLPISTSADAKYVQVSGTGSSAVLSAKESDLISADIISGTSTEYDGYRAYKVDSSELMDGAIQLYTAVKVTLEEDSEWATTIDVKAGNLSQTVTLTSDTDSGVFYVANVGNKTALALKTGGSSVVVEGDYIWVKVGTGDAAKYVKVNTEATGGTADTEIEETYTITSNSELSFKLATQVEIDA